MRAIAAFAVLLCVSAAAQTASPSPSGTPSTATQSSVPAGWPTAQFASAKDPSVQKAALILNDMIRALGGDAYLNLQNMTSEGRTYGFYHGAPNTMSRCPSSIALRVARIIRS